MDIISVVLVMLLAVVAGSWLDRVSPVALPPPLVQIVLGAGIGLTTDLRVNLNPDVFFLLFLPPMLFLDGWRIPKDGLLRDKGAILALAFGLVVFTVVGVGHLIHWMIPATSIPVAFALAAVLAPTDPIAVSAIAQRVPMPNRFLRILEGESLLNDASGLVSLRFAVAAALTGAFSPLDATATLLWLVSCGVLTGFVTTWTVAKAKNWVALRYGEETGAQILISLLMPFAAYIAAEHLGGSGILAAVTAGITMSYVEMTGQALAVTRIRREAVWDMVRLALDGIIFVLLGEQLPAILKGAAQTVRESGHHDPKWLAIYVVAIVVALGSTRFAWVWTSAQFTLFRRANRGLASKKPTLWLVAAVSASGVRGTVTLAGALSLPDGTAFPTRDLAIFLAAGVIVVSQVLASIVLPALLKRMELPPEPSYQQEEDQIRIGAAEAAIRAIEEARNKLARARPNADCYATAASYATDPYRRRIDGLSQIGEAAVIASEISEIEQELRLEGLRAERYEILRLTNGKLARQALARRLVRELDLAEARYVIP
ncbi:sodium/proton antiporter, CPA1 family [Rhizobiales bacterium GAS191]|nr:sodium/proton antiporter, CPA1 family [Rhizobiales bacterium GAS191]